MGCLQFLALECFPESHRDSVRWCQNVIETILKRCTTYNYFCGVYAKNKSAAAGHQLIDTHYWSDHRNDMWFLQKLIRKPKGQDEPQPSLTNHSVHANSRCLLFLGSKLTSSCLIYNTWLKLLNTSTGSKLNNESDIEGHYFYSSLPLLAKEPQANTWKPKSFAYLSIPPPNTKFYKGFDCSQPTSLNFLGVLFMDLLELLGVLFYKLNLLPFKSIRPLPRFFQLLHGFCISIVLAAGSCPVMYMGFCFALYLMCGCPCRCLCWALSSFKLLRSWVLRRCSWRIRWISCWRCCGWHWWHLLLIGKLLCQTWSLLHGLLLLLLHSLLLLHGLLLCQTWSLLHGLLLCQTWSLLHGLLLLLLHSLLLLHGLLLCQTWSLLHGLLLLLLLHSLLLLHGLLHGLLGQVCLQWPWWWHGRGLAKTCRKRALHGYKLNKELSSQKLQDVTDYTGSPQSFQRASRMSPIHRFTT